MEADVGRNRVLRAIAGTMVRPSAIFGALSSDPDRYLASSVAIFAAVCLVSPLPHGVVWFESDGSTFDGFGNGMWTYARSLANAVLANFLLIAAIFWVGSRYGGNRGFKSTFPVLSYCLIPIAVLAAAALVETYLFDPLGFMHGGGYMGGGSLDLELSRSFALGFAGSIGIFLIQSAFAASFMAWSFVLFIKAAKISRGFGTDKAVGVLVPAIAITYALTSVFHIIMGLFLAFAWHCSAGTGRQADPSCRPGAII